MQNRLFQEHSILLTWTCVIGENNYYMEVLFYSTYAIMIHIVVIVFIVEIHTHSDYSVNG